MRHEEESGSTRLTCPTCGSTFFFLEGTRNNRDLKGRLHIDHSVNCANCGETTSWTRASDLLDSQIAERVNMEARATYRSVTNSDTGESGDAFDLEVEAETKRRATTA